MRGYLDTFISWRNLQFFFFCQKLWSATWRSDSAYGEVFKFVSKHENFYVCSLTTKLRSTNSSLPNEFWKFSRLLIFIPNIAGYVETLQEKRRFFTLRLTSYAKLMLSWRQDDGKFKLKIPQNFSHSSDFQSTQNLVFASANTFNAWHPPLTSINLIPQLFYFALSDSSRRWIYFICQEAGKLLLHLHSLDLNEKSFLYSVGRWKHSLLGENSLRGLVVEFELNKFPCLCHKTSHLRSTTFINQPCWNHFGFMCRIQREKARNLETKAFCTIL